LLAVDHTALRPKHYNCHHHSLVPQRPPLPGLHLIVTFASLNISLDEPRTFTFRIALPVAFPLPLAVLVPAARRAAKRVVGCKGQQKGQCSVHSRRMSAMMQELLLQ
jgi:hypothetical protein